MMNRTRAAGMAALCFALAAPLAQAASLTQPGATAPGAQAATAAAVPQQQIALTRKSVGTYYVQAAIGSGAAQPLLVDTGSSLLVIDQTLADRLEAAGEARYSRPLRGRLADGSARIVPIYEIDGLRLGESCWIPKVEAAVFPAGSRPILGMGVLARLAPFTLSTEPAHLALSHCATQRGGGGEALAAAAPGPGTLD